MNIFDIIMNIMEADMEQRKKETVKKEKQKTETVDYKTKYLALKKEYEDLLVYVSEIKKTLYMVADAIFADKK